MWTFVLILTMPSLAHACIPTKTIDKGIPAVPGGPSGPGTLQPPASPCGQLSVLGVQECNAKYMPSGFTCSAAMFTSTSVTCADATSVLVIKDGTGAISTFPKPPLNCVGTDWTIDVGGGNLMTLQMMIGAPTAAFACRTN